MSTEGYTNSTSTDQNEHTDILGADQDGEDHFKSAISAFESPCPAEDDLRTLTGEIERGHSPDLTDQTVGISVFKPPISVTGRPYTQAGEQEDRLKTLWQTDDSEDSASPYPELSDIQKLAEDIACEFACRGIESNAKRRIVYHDSNICYKVFKCATSVN